MHTEYITPFTILLNDARNMLYFMQHNAERSAERLLISMRKEHGNAIAFRIYLAADRIASK